MGFVSWKDYKGVTTDLEAIYQASTEQAAKIIYLAAMNAAKKWVMPIQN